MNYELPTNTKAAPLEMMAPLRLSFLAAVKRIDRLRSEVFSCDGQSLIAKADAMIDRLTASFKQHGSAPTSDVISLVKFAGYMDDYVHDPDSDYLSLASNELGSNLMAAA